LGQASGLILSFAKAISFHENVISPTKVAQGLAWLGGKEKH